MSAVSVRVERLEGVVVDEEQVDTDELAHLGVVAGVETGCFQPLVHLVGPFEVHTDATAAGDVTERGGQESSCRRRPGQRQTAPSSAASALRGAGDLGGAPVVRSAVEGEEFQAVGRCAVAGGCAAGRFPGDDSGGRHGCAGVHGGAAVGLGAVGGGVAAAAGAGRFAEASFAAIPQETQDAQIGSADPARANEPGR